MNDRISSTISITWFLQVFQSWLVKSQTVSVCIWLTQGKLINHCLSLLSQPHFSIHFLETVQWTSSPVRTFGLEWILKQTSGISANRKSTTLLGWNICSWEVGTLCSTDKRSLGDALQSTHPVKPLQFSSDFRWWILEAQRWESYRELQQELLYCESWEINLWVLDIAPVIWPCPDQGRCELQGRAHLLSSLVEGVLPWWTGGWGIMHGQHPLAQIWGSGEEYLSVPCWFSEQWCGWMI